MNQRFDVSVTLEDFDLKSGIHWNKSLEALAVRFESSYNTITTEGIADTAKALVTKFVAWLKDLWAKLRETFKKFTGGTQQQVKRVDTAAANIEQMINGGVDFNELTKKLNEDKNSTDLALSERAYFILKDNSGGISSNLKDNVTTFIRDSGEMFKLYEKQLTTLTKVLDTHGAGSGGAEDANLADRINDRFNESKGILIEAAVMVGGATIVNETLNFDEVDITTGVTGYKFVIQGEDVDYDPNNGKIINQIRDAGRFANQARHAADIISDYILTVDSNFNDFTKRVDVIVNRLGSGTDEDTRLAIKTITSFNNLYTSLARCVLTACRAILTAIDELLSKLTQTLNYKLSE